MVECSELLENVNLAEIYAPDFATYSNDVFEASVAALKKIGAKNWEKNEKQFRRHVEKWSWLSQNVRTVGCRNPAGDGSLDLSDFNVSGPDNYCYLEIYIKSRHLKNLTIYLS